MKLLENASQSEGISLYILMQNAGKALFSKVQEIADAKSIKKIILVCGKGNNGGDGFICASLLAQLYYDVTVVLLCGKPQTDLAIKAFEKMPENIRVKESPDIIYKNTIIVDCVYGTGFKGQLRSGTVCDTFRQINTSGCFVISCDIPSGNNAESGTACDNAIKADVTVCLGAEKTGMLFNPCRENCGKVEILDIGIPDICYQSLENIPQVLDKDYVLSLLPERKSDANKGTFGKLLNISGSRNYIGAALLSSKAALRSGTGLCTLCSYEKVIDNISGQMPETIYEYLSDDAEKDIDLIMKKAAVSSAVLIGCGMGNNERTSETVKRLVYECKCPLIIDADGLNVLAPCIDILRKAKASIILTPHPGEFSRLTGLTINEILDNRLRLCEDFAREYGVTVILKGAGTVISYMGKKTYISTTGNSGLSRGGSGDVLAGMTASFAAQGLTAENAACLSVYLHGLAADRVADKLSKQGMLPSDIIDELPLLFRELNR